MHLSNYIRIVPLPYIREIKEDGTILLKTAQNFQTFYTLNDLSIAERQRRKNGSDYFEQQITVKLDARNAYKQQRRYFAMPCVVEIFDTEGNKKLWGNEKYPVRLTRRSRANGDEYKLKRLSIKAFLI